MVAPLKALKKENWKYTAATQQPQRETQECDFCGHNTGHEFISISVKSFNGITTQHYCDFSCVAGALEDYLSEEVAERAVRDEIAVLHSEVCPACKRAIQRRMEKI